MVHEKEQFLEKILTLLYLFVTILTFYSVYAYYYNLNIKSLLINKEYNFLLINITLIWYFLIKFFNLTKFHRSKSGTQMFFDHIIVVILGMGCISILIAVFKLGQISRFFMFLFALVNLIMLFSSRHLTNILVTEYRRKGHNIRNLLIVADDQSDEIIQKYISNKFWGYNIKVIITDSDFITEKYIRDYAVLPTNTNIDKFIEYETIDEVVYSKSNYSNNELEQLIYSCQEIGVKFHLLSPLHNLIASQAHISQLDNISFFSFYKGSSDYIKLKIKRIVDLAFSLIILILFFPFLLIIALLIKLTSRGPVIFKQKRIGLYGRMFYVYKFRTMVYNAEEIKTKLRKHNEQSGPVFKIKNDPRVTKIGKFLRKTSLDEFPQFFNVLKGDMSIVGPRPLPPEDGEKYERWQLRRLSMKPGITCIWQVSGRNNIKFEEWMKMDLKYIDNWSPKLDFMLLVKTIRNVFLLDGQ
jgi:exopolysaccharide biosynthesis polyprenyl glycosylphosphotransferase